MSKAPPSRTADRIIVRLPDGMRDRIASRARENERSATAEVVAALDAWLAGERSTEAEIDPNLTKSIHEHAQKAMTLMMERIEREPLPVPRMIQEMRKPENRLSDKERADLEYLRTVAGAENVEVVEQRFLVARVKDTKSGTVNEKPLGQDRGTDRTRLDLDVAIVKRALGRDDIEVPVMQGRVLLSLLPIEPMTRMILTTLLGYAGRDAELTLQPTLLERLEKFGMDQPPASDDAALRARSGPAKRKLGT